MQIVGRHVGKSSDEGGREKRECSEASGRQYENVGRNGVDNRKMKGGKGIIIGKFREEGGREYLNVGRKGEIKGKCREEWKKE